MNNLTTVAREIVEATGYPANDLLDGIVIEPPFEDTELAETYPGTIRYTRFTRNSDGLTNWARGDTGGLEQEARVGSADLPEGVWERLELACLAEDPALKGRKLVGGVVIRSQHAYFLPEGEDQQWVSNDVIDLS